MIYRLFANLVLIVHLAFVLFVLLGSFITLRWSKLTWFHLAAVLWGALTEFAGIVCPLTPLEVTLRQHGGEAGYDAGFIEHYVSALLYPAGLTRTLQIWLGFAALLPNILIYSYILVRKRRSGASRGLPTAN
jgi:hypothetical protein